MKNIGTIVLVALALGGCSSAMDLGSSGDEGQIRRIGHIAPVERAVTSAGERKRLIDRLIKERNHHREDALRDIEAR